MATITIDGKDYDADTLSADARAQLINVQVTDQKIADLQAQMAIYQTARAAYARELLALLHLGGTAVEADSANSVH